MPPQLRWFMRTTFIPAASKAQHILRFARSLQPVNHNQGQPAPILLPVTVAKDRNARLYFDRAFLGDGEMDSAGKKERSQRLYMPTPQPAMWLKNCRDERGRGLRIPELRIQRPSLRSSHKMILIGARSLKGSERHADFRIRLQGLSARV